MTNKMYAVGLEYDGGWKAISATSKRQAKRIFLKSNRDVWDKDAVLVERAKIWDKIQGPITASDWLDFGFQYTCDFCGEITDYHDEPPAVIIDGEVVCGECAKIPS